MEDGGIGRGSRLRKAAAFGGGAVLALLASAIETASRSGDPRALPPAGNPAWWAVDRDADAVYALDRNLIVARCLRIGSPLEVRATGDGGAWILRSSSGTAPGGRSLVRIRDDGSIAREIALGTCAGLSVLDGDDALVIDDGNRLVRCDAGGGTRVLLEDSSPSCAIDVGSAILVGSRSGEIRRLRTDPLEGDAECIRLDGPILALASARDGSRAYVLLGGPDARLGLLDFDSSLVWTTPIGDPAASIASTPEGAEVWLAEPGDSRIRRFARDGGLEAEFVGLEGPTGMDGLGGCVADTDGGLVFATPGALLRLDRRGRNRPGQGGFAFLSGVDRIPDPPKSIRPSR